MSGMRFYIIGTRETACREINTADRVEPIEVQYLVQCLGCIPTTWGIMVLTSSSRPSFHAVRQSSLTVHIVITALNKINVCVD